MVAMSQQSLVALAQRAKAAFDQTNKSRSEWVEATFELADTLREARELLPSNEAFSLWLDEQAGIRISKDDRSALIKLSTFAGLAREVLERHPSCWSWRTCWQEVRRVRSLRTRQDEDQTEEDDRDLGDNVVRLRLAAEAPDADDPGAQPLSPHADFSPQYFPPTQAGLAIDALCSFLHAAKVTAAGHDEIVRHWATKRGDRVPSPEEAREDLRDVTAWFEALIAALERYEARRKTKRRRPVSDRVEE
jgi:hypothetical protein